MKLSLCLLCIHFLGSAISQDLVYKKDIVYAKAPDWRRNLQDLKLDLIYPPTGKKMPLIVYLHGGGFAESSRKDYPVPFCERLAREGFVVANVEYRGGFDETPEKFKSEITKAVYRAQQDELAALRFLAHHEAEYPVDSSLVFLAGESAGGVTSLFTAYVSQDDWNSSGAGVGNELGTINHSGNHLQDRVKIKGVINLWGGIADTSFISLQEMLAMPVLLFHSVDDKEIPFEQATHPEANRKMLQGSGDIARRFKNNNACFQFYYIRGARHAYGFSSDYLATAITRFLTDIRNGRCNSTEIENKSGNKYVHFLEPETSPLPNREREIIALSPEVLQQYAGRYEGNNIVIIITVEGDHLKVQPPNQEPVILYPKTENKFFSKEFDSEAEFVKDASGKVIDHVVHGRDRELHFKKIK